MVNPDDNCVIPETIKLVVVILVDNILENVELVVFKLLVLIKPEFVIFAEVIFVDNKLLVLITPEFVILALLIY